MAETPTPRFHAGATPPPTDPDAQPQVHAGGPAGGKSLTDARDAGIADHALGEKQTETTLRSLQNARRSTVTEFPRVFHKGTNYVEKTGPAILKRGEAVIPAEKNPMNPDKKKSKLFDAVTKKPDHLSLRKAHGGYVLTICDDQDDDKNGEHILVQEIYDALCAAYKADPTTFKSPLWGKLFNDIANAEAAENPSGTVDKVVQKSPAEITGGPQHLEQRSNPFPKVVTKSSQGAI